MTLIDISVPISKNTPHWPTSQAVDIKRCKSLKGGDDWNESRLAMDVHCGTHLDAPSHFLAKGKAIDEIKLNKLIGKCYVCDTDNVGLIDSDYLQKIKMPEGVKKIIFKTKNSKLWGNSSFYENFVALSSSGAEWIVRHDIDLVGIDYLSIQPFGQKDYLTHKILLKKEVVVVEGLNLQDVEQGVYELIVLPINIKGAEGAPARAILKDSQLKV